MHLYIVFCDEVKGKKGKRKTAHSFIYSFTMRDPSFDHILVSFA